VVRRNEERHRAGSVRRGGTLCDDHDRATHHHEPGAADTGHDTADAADAADSDLDSAGTADTSTDANGAADTGCSAADEPAAQPASDRSEADYSAHQYAAHDGPQWGRSELLNFEGGLVMQTLPGFGAPEYGEPAGIAT
jgi:hypothetical protein